MNAHRDFLAWPMLAAALLLLFTAAGILANTAADDRALAGLAEGMAVLGAVLLGGWVAMVAAGFGGKVVTGQKNGPLRGRLKPPKPPADTLGAGKSTEEMGD